MRQRTPLILVALALVLSGCSHFDDTRDDGWTTRLADAVEVHGSRADRAPLPAVDGAPAPADAPTNTGWAEPSVRPTPAAITEPLSDRGPHAVAHADGPYLLDSDDRLRIFVYGQPNLSRIYTVDHDGKIMMPLIGILRARQRTTYELASVIRSRLGAEFVRDPQVTVDIHENRPFFILGEVRTPGRYPYVNGMTVETAVAIAGGYTPRARKSRFRISRRVDGIVEVAKGHADYVLRPGDTVNVAERFF